MSNLSLAAPTLRPTSITTAGPAENSLLDYLKPLSIEELGDRSSRRYLIKGLLGMGEMSVWYGDAGCGKSFFLLETARCIAANKPWFGRKVSQGAVIYIMCEGGNGAWKRVQALRVAHDTGTTAPLYILPKPLKLLNDPECINGLIHWVKELNASLIVIDTLNRAMAGGEENSSKDMGDFISSCDEIRNRTGAHVAIIHHNGSNKDKRGRGHTSLEGAADTMVLIEKHSTGHTAKVTKNKDDKDSWSIGFQLEVITIDKDEDGDPITSCAVIPANIPSSSKQRYARETSRALKALTDVMEAKGDIITNHPDIPDQTRCAVFDDWRLEFYSQKPGAQEAKKKAFQRASNFLQNTGRVQFHDSFVWVTNTSGQNGTLSR
tara:strand:+ start:67 stop:1197 length:1131 start_codon:yes stop_codon:yes gene_type:complete